MNVAAWLQGLGLDRYTRAFEEHGVDADVLPRLSAADLAELGVAAVGHRRKLLTALAALGGPAAAAAGRRQLTVMFVDLVDSTALSARLDPEELREVLRAYQGTAAAEIARFEGLASRFLGDGVVAYFGLPRAHEDDAERAVRAGLAVVEAAGRLRAPDGAPLRVRVGVATGLVVIGGPLCGGPAVEPAAVGETPNLAARLQALAEPGTVVVADRTLRLVPGLFDALDLGARPVKGLAEPIRAWRVLGRSRAEGRFEARQAGGGGRGGLTPLVGREAELACLVDRWRRARDGAGQVVLLAGEPGIGKSRAVRALIDRLGGEPHLRLHLRCSPLHASTPFHPVAELLERAAGFARGDGPERKLGKLRALLARGAAEGVAAAATPLFASLLSIPAGDRGPAPDAAPPRVVRERTLAAMLEQLEGLARGSPVLLVFEDAHWSDPSSLDLLDGVVERVRALRVLTIVSFRPEFAPRWTGPHVTALALEHLGAAEARALVRRLGAAAGALSAAAVEQIVERADGVPLFLEELTKAVLESALPAAADRARREDPLPAAAIPSSLQDSLVARLDRLAAVREVAQTAACLGRDFGHALLAAVSPWPEPRLVAALDRLVEAGLLFRFGDPPDARYSFKHALVRDVAYATLLHSQRRRLHGRIAAAIRERFPELARAQPQLLAQHCAEAGLAADAIAHWRRAGLLAARRSAMQEATAQLGRALDLVPLLPDGPERARRELELQVALGSALLAAEGEAAPGIGRAFRRAHELHRSIGGAGVEPALFWGVWHYHANRAELATAREIARDLVARAERDGSAAERALGHRCALVVELFAGRPAPALARLDRIEALPRPERGGCPDEVLLDPWITARSVASWAALLRGRPRRAVLAGGEAALAEARAAGRPYMLAVVLHHQNVLRQLLGDRRTLADRAAELLRLAREHGFAHWHATATLLRGWTVAGGGALEDGLEEMRRGLAAKRATGSRLKLPYYLGLMAGLLAEAGRAREALPLLAEALDQVEATGERWFEAELHRLRGEALLRIDPERTQPAAACFAAAIHVARGQRAVWWERRAARCLAAVAGAPRAAAAWPGHLEARAAG